MAATQTSSLQSWSWHLAMLAMSPSWLLHMLIPRSVCPTFQSSTLSAAGEEGRVLLLQSTLQTLVILTHTSTTLPHSVHWLLLCLPRATNARKSSSSLIKVLSAASARHSLWAPHRLLLVDQQLCRPPFSSHCSAPPQSKSHQQMDALPRPVLEKS